MTYRKHEDMPRLFLNDDHSQEDQLRYLVVFADMYKSSRNSEERFLFNIWATASTHRDHLSALHRVNGEDLIGCRANDVRL